MDATLPASLRCGDLRRRFRDLSGRARRGRAPGSPRAGQERGSGRDDVRLLVARAEPARARTLHTPPRLRDPGDLLVTTHRPAAGFGRGARGRRPALPQPLGTVYRGERPHLWVHRAAPAGCERYRGGRRGPVLMLTAGGTAVCQPIVAGSGASSCGCRGRSRAIWPATRAHSLWPPHRSCRTRSFPHRLRDRTGQRRDAQRRAGVHARARDSADRARCGPSLRSCSTPECPWRDRRDPRARALPGSPFTAARINLTRELGGRVILCGRHHVGEALEVAAGGWPRAREHGLADLVIEANSRIRALRRRAVPLSRRLRLHHRPCSRR